MTGSLVARVICKATTEEMSAPKRKHLDVLTRLSFEPKLSIPDFSKFLLDRLRSQNWVVVFKTLITTHHLMHYGSDQFSQFLATNHSQLKVNKFADRNNASIFHYITTYANFLETRSRCIAQAGFDFCKLKRGREEENMRGMPINKLMKNIPMLCQLADALAQFNATAVEIQRNSVMCAAHLLLYVDMIRLYAAYNEGIINLMDKYFSLQKKQCQEALCLYKEYLKRMDVMSAFIKIGEEVRARTQGTMTNDDSLLFKKMPDSALEALETHLANLENDKKGQKALPSVSSPALWDKPHVQTESKPMTTAEELGISEELMKNIIEDERRRLDSFVKKTQLQVQEQTPQPFSFAEDALSYEDLNSLADPFSPPAQAATFNSCDFFASDASSKSGTTDNGNPWAAAKPPPQQSKPRTIDEKLAELANLSLIDTTPARAQNVNWNKGGVAHQPFVPSHPQQPMAPPQSLANPWLTPSMQPLQVIFSFQISQTKT
ncbi:hypothetical protein Ciccas_004117 [Cichlidogyrus casuarinus]|uniref:ENTH domain-containing protein n=1 Tax=Cichlidogyrus casuarinus TaxID=1844966 RepID=A0ABD2QCF1_9PLAT